MCRGPHPGCGRVDERSARRSRALAVRTIAGDALLALDRRAPPPRSPRAARREASSPACAPPIPSRHGEERRLADEAHPRSGGACARSSVWPAARPTSHDYASTRRSVWPIRMASPRCEEPRRRDARAVHRTSRSSTRRPRPTARPRGVSSVACRPTTVVSLSSRIAFSGPRPTPAMLVRSIDVPAGAPGSIARRRCGRAARRPRGAPQPRRRAARCSPAARRPRARASRSGPRAR